MNLQDDEIQKLKNRLIQLNDTIGLATAKKQEAELAVNKLGQELEHLSSLSHEISQDLQRLEANVCNMWENIGEGG